MTMTATEVRAAEVPAFKKICIRAGDLPCAIPSEAAVLVVCKGELELRFASDEGERMCRAGERDVLIVRANDNVRFCAVGECDAVCEMYKFSVVGTCSGIFLLEVCPENTLVCSANGATDEFFDYIERLKAELDGSFPSRADTVQGLSLCAVSALARAMNIGEDKLKRLRSTKRTDVAQESEHADEISELLNFIDESLSTDIGIERLASMAHMSRSRLYKVFKRHTGMTINEYILHRRVEHTVRLLSDTDCSVIEAAYDSGFTSSSGFYKTFKRIAGCSPKEYMKKLRDAQASENII